MFAEAGFLVILPDYFRGEVFPESLRDQGEFMCRHTKWENLRVDLEEIVIPFARLNGHTWDCQIFVSSDRTKPFHI